MSAPINQLGYGIAGLNILASLSETDEVALFPIGGRIDPRDVPPDKRDIVESARIRGGFYDDRAPSMRVWMQGDLAEHVGRGPRIGFPFFELRQLSARECHHMGRLDRLVVASRWAADICVDHHLPEPVVAPLGVDRAIFHEGVVHDRRDGDQTVFVNVGKWEVRKGHDVLLRAFNRAFEPSDKVILKMLSTCPFLGQGNDRWTRLYMTSRMGVAGRISVEQRRLASQAEVAAFMVAADAAVFPARAEAWNLDLLECMSCGLHCICTDYAGHTEYASEPACRLIRVDELETAADGFWFRGEGQWAMLGEGQEEQIIEHMRAIHRLKQTGGLARNEEAIGIAKGLAWRRTTDILGGIL